MSLAISIAYLGDVAKNHPESADRFEQDLTNLNAILEQHGLQSHQEPVRLEDIQMRATCGYDVPQDFTDVIVDDSGTIPGRMIGSSHRLLRELAMVAPALEIVFENGELSDAEAKRINEVGASNKGCWIEYIVWIVLFEAARMSIEHNTLIVFG
jgi:hypothetical protein